MKIRFRAYFHIFLKYFLTIFFVYTNSSCSLDEAPSEIDIDIDKKSIKLSSIIEDYSYIKLETTNNSRIGILENVQYYQNRLYVLDFIKEKSVFIYSDSGKFLKKISSSTPGLEFSAPQRIQVSKSSNTIQVFDPHMRGISIYSLDGNYIGLKDIIDPPRSYILLDKGGFLFEYDEFPSKNHRIHILNDNLQPLEKYLPKESSLSICNGMSLSIDNKYISYIPSFSKTIYAYQNKRFQKRFELNFKNGWITNKEIEKLSKMKYPNWALEFERKYPLLRPDHFSTEKYIAIPFLWQKNDYTLFIDKSNKLAIGPNFVDDIGIGNINMIRGVAEDYFIGVLDSQELLKRKLNKQIQDSILLNLTKSLDANDNPILFKFKLSQ